MKCEGTELRSSPLDRLEALLGEDVFFVPCEWGRKKPLVTYVERPFEATKSEAYRALFAVQEVNVAVYLGQASGGLWVATMLARFRAQDLSKQKRLQASRRQGQPVE